MLAQVVLVMRTPFEGQRTIGADKGTHSSVDTLMNLEINIYTHLWRYTWEISSISKILLFSDKILLDKMTLTSCLEQRGTFEGFAAVLTFVRLLS